MVLYDETQPKKGRGGGMLLGWDEFQFVILRLNFMKSRLILTNLELFNIKHYTILPQIYLLYPFHFNKVFVIISYPVFNPGLNMRFSLWFPISIVYLTTLSKVVYKVDTLDALQ